MEVSTAKPRKIPQNIFFLVDAAGVPAEPKGFHHKICEGVEDRTKYEIHLDNGGPNREDPAVVDTPALLVTINGKRWKINIPDIAKEIIGMSWSTGQKA